MWSCQHPTLHVMLLLLCRVQLLPGVKTSASTLKGSTFGSCQRRDFMVGHYFSYSGSPPHHDCSSFSYLCCSILKIPLKSLSGIFLIDSCMLAKFTEDVASPVGSHPSDLDVVVKKRLRSGRAFLCLVH